MKTLSRPRVHIKTIFTLVALLLFNFPQISQAAALVTVQTPSQIQQNQAFDVEINIAAQPESSYYLKILIGQDETAALTQGQIYNETSNSWLGYNDTWNKFPSVTTNAAGEWSGIIKARTTTNSNLGTSYLVVRIRNQNGTNTDSLSSTLEVTAAPKPTTPTTNQQIKLSLTEFMPTGKEWVEIKNIGTKTADLSGWQIDDELGKSTPTLIPNGTSLAPGKYFVLYLKSSKLNDGSDAVRLLKPDGSQVEIFKYTKVEKEKSWAKNENGKWYLAQKPTPGKDNLPNPNSETSNNESASENKNPLETNKTSQKIDNTSPLPEILGTSATSSANQATVSANFVDKNLSSPTNFNLAFILIGSFLTFTAIVFAIKQNLTHRAPKQEVIWPPQS